MMILSRVLPGSSLERCLSTSPSWWTRVAGLQNATYHQVKTCPHCFEIEPAKSSSPDSLVWVPLVSSLRIGIVITKSGRSLRYLSLVGLGSGRIGGVLTEG